MPVFGNRSTEAGPGLDPRVAGRPVQLPGAPSTEPDQSPTAEKLQDIDAARGAVVDAAEICSGLWLSYILAVSYVTVVRSAWPLVHGW